MKKNALFDRCVAGVDPEVMQEVNLNIDIANRIYDILKAKNLSQRQFAALLGKRESEISRWLTGAHGFTTSTLAKIAAVLGEPVVEVAKSSRSEYIFVPVGGYISPSDTFSGAYVDRNKDNYVRMAYFS
ncbi:MAG TPA: helix-turn-helix domain-containing protein [Candidatus Avibacteroides excrementipullorum]|nr:helix-turn-helix domain-containing protein [Candidatus Avibacteroides excrementipullorum]